MKCKEHRCKTIFEELENVKRDRRIRVRDKGNRGEEKESGNERPIFILLRACSGNAIDARYRWLKLQWTETAIFFDVAGYGTQQIPSIRSTKRNEEESRADKDEGRRKEYIFEGKRFVFEDNPFEMNYFTPRTKTSTYLRQVLMKKKNTFSPSLSLSYVPQSTISSLPRIGITSNRFFSFLQRKLDRRSRGSIGRLSHRI